jgi:hypothetical protein
MPLPPNAAYVTFFVGVFYGAVLTALGFSVVKAWRSR